MTKAKIKRIIILGAGYCGLQTALSLNKKLQKKQFEDFQVILIDQSPRHVYLAELYEIGSSFYQHRIDSCSNELSQTLSISLRQRFENQKVNVVVEKVQAIDSKKKTVTLGNQEQIDYNYLVVALGSVTNFYNIPGLEGNVYELKTMSQSLKLNCDLDEFFRQPENLRREVNIVIGGGGFTGVELAAELIGYLKKLSERYGFDHQQVNLKVIQSTSELVNLGPKISQITLDRFKNLGIESLLNTKVIKYQKRKTQSNTKSAGKIQLENVQTGENSTLDVDFLVWTAGIKPNQLLSKSFSKLSPAGELEANQYLQSIHYSNIYVGGDNALIVDPKTKKALHKLGQLALKQGKLIAQNILTEITQKKSLKIYQPDLKGFMLALGGRYGIFKRGNFIISGFLPFLLKKAFDLYYYLNILPFRSALKKWYKNFIIFSSND